MGTSTKKLALKQAVCAIFFATGAPAPVIAATFNSPAQSTIIQPVTIAKTADLQFGRVITNTAANRVTISQTTGARTASLGVTTLAPGAPFSRATFTIAGAPGLTTTITLPATVTLTRSGGGATMTVTTFRRTPTGNPVIPATGSYTLNIGARLNVAANQAVGNYTGSFAITTNYQ